VGALYRDQSVLSGHDGRPHDLERIAGLGIKALRYPLLWESFAASSDPEQLWAWHDHRLARLSDLGVRPILGLIHHGSGPAHTDLLADGFASGLAEHARQAAVRYPWVQDWTPVNEPLTTARFSALYGHWHPHRRDERSFWNALINQIDAIRASMAQIRAVIPSARLIQTEDLGFTSATPERQAQAGFDNARRWASWDMLSGRLPPEEPLWRRLTEMGFDTRLQSLRSAPCPPTVMGINHYLTSDRFLDHDTQRHPVESHGECFFGPMADVAAVRVLERPAGLEGAIRDCWERYRIPIALTEIHNGCTREDQLRWIMEAWNCATKLRADGIEIEAVTAWNLMGSYDWNSLLTLQSGHYESGVFDIRSPVPRETALAPLLRQLATGAAPDHPVLNRTGWWRQHSRTNAVRPLLIAGATGTLGQAFAAACRQRGLDYVLTDRAALDLSSPQSVASILNDTQPWAVINCAGWVRVDEAENRANDCLQANYHGSVSLAQACHMRSIHYTSFSSDLVFDGTKPDSYAENDVTAPLGAYGTSKAKADRELALMDGRNLTVRTSSFFSADDQHNFAVHLINALRDGQPFLAATDCITSPTYVPDLVRVTLDLIIDDENGLWHIVNDGQVSWAGFAFALGEACGLPTRHIKACPASEMGWVASRPANGALTSERGLLMPSLHSAIDRFAAAMTGS